MEDPRPVSVWCSCGAGRDGLSQLFLSLCSSTVSPACLPSTFQTACVQCVGSRSSWTSVRRASLRTRTGSPATMCILPAAHRPGLSLTFLSWSVGRGGHDPGPVVQALESSRSQERAEAMAPSPGPDGWSCLCMSSGSRLTRSEWSRKLQSLPPKWGHHRGSCQFRGKSSRCQEHLEDAECADAAPSIYLCW